MKRIYLHISFILVIFLLLPVTNINANTGLTIQLDRTEISMSDSIQMTIKVSGTQSAVRPRVGGLQNFRVQSGGTSSNFSMVNGQVSSSIDQTYYLYPKRTGKFTIGPAEVNINGKTYRSNHVSVVVKNQPSDISQQSHKPVFITASLSNSKAYIGQTVFYKVKFYYSISVRDLGIVLPESNGFRLKQLEKHLEYTSNVKGKQYKVIEINHVLSTEKTGTFNIDPTMMKMNILERQKSSNRFSMFGNFFTNARPHSVQTQAVKLTILPLPDANRPSDFTGLVGNFSIQAQLDPKKIPSGESATLSLQISGQGNVQLMPDINIPEMKHIKLYSDQPVISINETPSGFTGQKSMKWALVPQKEGEYNIGPFSLSFFDPKTEKYKTISTSKMNLTVTPGKKVAVTTIPSQINSSLPQVKKEVKFFQRDILPVHDHADALTLSIFQQMASWHKLIIFLFPPFIYLVVLLLFFRKTRLKLEKLAAKKAFSKLTKQLNTTDTEKNIPEMLKAFNQFFNDRLQLEGGTLTPDEVQNILTLKGISNELALETKSLLINLEAAVYTGQSDQDVNKLKNSISELGKKLDKGIKG